MAANYNRPKPIDPIWYRRSCTLRIWCACGRSIKVSVGEFAAARAIPPDTQLYKLIARLRCSGCGGRPTADVVRGPNG
ncbi:hypothetical protein FHS51_003372 [Sphingobium wenxiniae]|uniref:hypothetical protein n=1 Tax=Sphingobium wenxiniae (strain DSM 21828 / CGMCC 1.7748 / JZ-1) TaxID=595605 RepID=UPI0011A193C4|nr:hypothetical protein [Sphingobium wenxiniae]MBB6193116.1 hypothetical protein [Sphingobium wenxiniae]|tara:strand:- start:41060 stop:41293 length:234 start_codon:yes stop_codon:yes gene_type:complete